MFLLLIFPLPCCFIFFFFNDTATTEIYTLSLHDALPIYLAHVGAHRLAQVGDLVDERHLRGEKRVRCVLDRKSTRLNSSHSQISYAVFCLKKKKTTQIDHCSLFDLLMFELQS